MDTAMTSPGRQPSEGRIPVFRVAILRRLHLKNTAPKGNNIPAQDNALGIAMWRPFRADLVGYSPTQGVALGWYLRPFQGCSMTRKTGIRPRQREAECQETLRWLGGDDLVSGSPRPGKPSKSQTQILSSRAYI
jgi:hypothetical protein